MRPRREPGGQQRERVSRAAAIDVISGLLSKWTGPLSAGDPSCSHQRNLPDLIPGKKAGFVRCLPHLCHTVISNQRNNSNFKTESSEDASWRSL